jgi:hypothetical protein
MLKNKYKRYVYVLGLQLPTIENFAGENLSFDELFKIGVFTGYVNSRVNSIRGDIDHCATVRIVKQFNVEGNINFYNLPNVRKNYVVELNAHNYLMDKNVKWFNLEGWQCIQGLQEISQMSGKTEWFNCTEQQAIMAVLSGIRYCETHPQKLLPSQFVNWRGCITKYGKGKVPIYA